jgi:hypothetical protein
MSTSVYTGLKELNIIRKTFQTSASGKSLCAYERCLKWRPRASIQAWTKTTYRSLSAQRLFERTVVRSISLFITFVSAPIYFFINELVIYWEITGKYVSHKKFILEKSFLAKDFLYVEFSNHGTASVSYTNDSLFNIKRHTNVGTLQETEGELSLH